MKIPISLASSILAMVFAFNVKYFDNTMNWHETLGSISLCILLLLIIWDGVNTYVD